MEDSRRMSRPVNDRAKIFVCLCIAGLALAWLGLEALRLAPPDSSERLIDVIALSGGGAAFLLAFLALVRLLRQTEPTEKPAGAERPEPAAGALPAALRCLDQPAMVVSEKGRIIHANPVAAAWLDGLGKPAAHIGDVVDRADFRQALVKARGERRPPPALLRRSDGGGEIAAKVADMGLQAGAVVVFDMGAAPLAAPARPGGRWGVAVDPEQQLTALPLTTLWMAAMDGRPTEIATVKLAGGRVYPSMSLDFVIAQPELGRAGRPFAEVWPELAQAMVGAVVVAENAAAVWAALQREMTATGFAAADPPPLIDLSRLAAAYDPSWAVAGAVAGGAGAGLDLDALAAALNIVEPVPARRLARVAARLAVGPRGEGLGNVGEFLCRSGDVGGDALKPPEITAQAGETTETP